MSDVVIIQDPSGLSMRVLAMQHAHPNVVPVAPASKRIGHCQAISPPESWLPDDPSIPSFDREWWKCDAVALAAVQQLGIDADFYWFIESDVAATQDRWKSFFKQFDHRQDDMLCLYKILRHPGNDRLWNGLPEEADTACLMSLYRLSRRMVERSIEMAPSMRNVFCEAAVPWVAKSAGWPVGILSLGGHYNSSTIGPRPRSITINKSLINHPVKTNTYEP